jgi:hypothetical protein
MAAVILGFLLSSTACRADVFNWPTTPAWTAGSPPDGNSQTVDYSSTGQAISVTLANFGGPGMTWNSGFPQVETNGTGIWNGGFPAGSGVNGLILQPGSQTSNATYIQVTINFTNPGGANNVSFQLWDIDATVDGSGNGFIDTIKNLQGITPLGATVYPTSVDNIHTSNPGIAYNNITGSGAGLVIAGDTVTNSAANNTDQGTVNIAFSQAVTSISFEYSNGASGSLTTQTMGIGPISFTPVPEVNPSNAALLLCGGVMGFGLLRRRSRNAESSRCPSCT